MLSFPLPTTHPVRYANHFDAQEAKLQGGKPPCDFSALRRFRSGSGFPPSFNGVSPTFECFPWPNSRPNLSIFVVNLV